VDVVELTQPEQAVLEALRSLYMKHHRPPSVREIGDACGYESTSTTHVHLKNLERKGVIRRGAPGSPRSLTIVSQDGTCPLCGHSLP
jgi:repressor LexA